MRHHLALPLLACAGCLSAVDLHVAPGGDDTNPGDAAKPFATPGRALVALRERRQGGDGPHAVILHAGTYRLTAPLAFGPQDGGSDGKPVTWRAAGDGPVVISGGRPVTGWKAATVAGRSAWQATVDGTGLPDGFRDLWVDGQRRTRARSGLIVPVGMARDTKGKATGIICADGAMAKWSQAQDVQIRQQVCWRHYILPVSAIRADALGQAVLESKEAANAEHLPPAFVGFKSFAPVTIENALALCDEPGEWYCDRSTGLLTYLPMPGERLDRIQALIPAQERLMTIAGTDGKPVTDLVFHGLTFADAGWASPNRHGWMGYDPGHIIRGKGGEGGFSFANLYGNDAQRIAFTRCTFTRLGGVGLHLNGVDGIAITGCVFDDIGSDGLGIGAVRDPKRAPTGVVVANTLFTRTNQDYRMGAALVTGKLKDATIHHNQVRNVPYIGLLVNKLFGKPPADYGKVSVRWNRVEDVMGASWDGGAFYTWMDGSSDQSMCLLADNHFRGIWSHDAQGVYLDNDCRFWQVERNVVEHMLGKWYLIKGSKHALADNHTDNAVCRQQDLHKPADITEVRTVVAPERDWVKHPHAQATIAAAGLEPAFRDLLTRLPSAAANRPPTAAIQAPSTVRFGMPARITGRIADDGQPHRVLHWRWERVSGPGTVNFYGHETRALDIPIGFGAPGTYVLRLTADDMTERASAEATITVEPADLGPDLAKGLPETAYTASKTNTPGQAPAKAFDGDAKTFWYPGFPGTGWLQVDLGRTVELKRIEMTLRRDQDHAHSRKEFEIVASNDADFARATVLGQQGLDQNPDAGGIWCVDLPIGASFRYVRYWKRLGFDGVVPELRVYGR